MLTNSTTIDPVKTQYRKWNMTVTPYTKSGPIIVVKRCFAFMFTNIGDTIASVNGMVIFPSATPATSLGDSRSISGHVLDVYTGIMNLAFAQPLGANPNVEIVQLFYVDDEKYTL